MSYRRTHDWSMLTRAEIKAARDEGALPVLTLGSCEQHGDHLPVDTDTLTAHRTSLLAAEACKDVHVLVLPAPSFGYSPHHLAWPGTISLSSSTLMSMIKDIASSLQVTGFDRLLIVNGHGGNDGLLKHVCTDLTCEGFPTGCVGVYSSNHDQLSPLLTGTTKSIDHACEFESSIAMALREEGRDLIAQRIKGLKPRTHLSATTKGIDPFEHVHGTYAAIFPGGDIGYGGDPAQATLEKGREMLSIAKDGLARFFANFAKADLVRGPLQSPPR